MAESSISVAQDQFNCPICLDVLKDPVTIPCGHTYCMSCITDCWNQDDEKKVYSCPQCRQTFTPKPALNKNLVFAEMVEKLKKTKVETARALSYAGPGDVECDVCTGRKRKAVKSCLVCFESYCQTHFERHEEFHSIRRHKVTDATRRLRQMICSKHDKQLEIYCRTDWKCICYLCTMDEHIKHDTVAAVVERTEKQKQLENTLKKFQQKIQDREKEVLKLKEAVKTHKNSAQAAVEDSERIFTELIRSIEARRSEVTQMIRDQEKAEVSRAEGLLKELEQEIEDLKRRDAELQQLSQTDDHIHFLQSFQSLSTLPGSTEGVTVSSLLSFGNVRNSVSQLREKLEKFCKEETKKISDTVTSINIIPLYEHKPVHKDFIKYSCQLSLDVNTVNKNVQLSEGDRVATCSETVQPYPDHPDRFNELHEVLCRESVNGRCYWEVEWSGTAGVGISVSYKSIKRQGKTNECEFGLNDQSWRLSCSPSSFSFWHKSIETKLFPVSRSYKIGVYVDYKARILCFYSISGTMTLIHRVQTTFTQPLYPGFLLNKGSSVKKLEDFCREDTEKIFDRGTTTRWEFKWSGTNSVGISVSYKSIKRWGDKNECGFGLNDQSWKLSCTQSGYSFWHNNKHTKLSVVSSSCRIGVYMDHRAGILCFYSVSDTMTLIHRVQTTFTQPLYPGFWLNLGSSVKRNHLTK
ncbi:tripartite motif-containing protein 16-like [Labeo rohita]|uniref:tripartite motif-containing protein 16-like n=1 Tax=Labeo rohita TaxID=84645 RepID=UPI0021E2B3B9|nr:tripartite motif-containing protein 16-like [Labeo rohita]